MQKFEICLDKENNTKSCSVKIAEIWKVIDEFPDFSISNLGRVFNNRKNVLVKQSTNTYGYLVVGLNKGKQENTRQKIVQKFVHLLVIEFFTGPRPIGKFANHKDGEKTNNKISNLEWVTSSENQKHAYSIGTKIPTSSKKSRNAGENHPRSKLKNSDVASIRKLFKSGKTM